MTSIQAKKQNWEDFIEGKNQRGVVCSTDILLVCMMIYGWIMTQMICNKTGSYFFYNAFLDNKIAKMKISNTSTSEKIPVIPNFFLVP